MTVRREAERMSGKRPAPASHVSRIAVTSGGLACIALLVGYSSGGSMLGLGALLAALALGLVALAGAIAGRRYTRTAAEARIARAGALLGGLTVAAILLMAIGVGLMFAGVVDTH